MAAIAGVYVIFGVGKRLYVGEAANMLTRNTLGIARRLGLDWNIVRYMPGSSGRERNRLEAQVMATYRDAGYDVVSHSKGSGKGIPKGSKGYQTRWSAARRLEHSTRMRVLMNRPEWKAKQSERLKAYNFLRTPEERSQYGFKSWVTRRARAQGKER